MIEWWFECMAHYTQLTADKDSRLLFVQDDNQVIIQLWTVDSVQRFVLCNEYT